MNVSSTSTRPVNGALSAVDITWRSLPSIVHAVWYEEIGSTRCRCEAETPLLLAVTSHTASNQTVNGVRARWKSVPEVTETCLRHLRHR